jgi:hypothetical protein
MKTVVVAGAVELCRRLGAWCATRPGGSMHLSMRAGAVLMTVHGSSHLGVSTATCAALLAHAPSTQMLTQAGRLALGNAARYPAGLALDESTDRLWLSHTLHDPSAAQICTALGVLRAQVRGWQKALDAQTRHERNPAYSRAAATLTPSTLPASWSMRR